MLRAKFHEMNLLYDRKFDVGQVEVTYDLKMGFASSHTFAVEAVQPGSHVLDIGCGQGYVAQELAAKAAESPASTSTCRESAGAECSNSSAGISMAGNSRWSFSVRPDLHSRCHRAPARSRDFHGTAARRGRCKRPEIVLTTANIGFSSYALHALPSATSTTAAKGSWTDAHPAFHVQLAEGAVRPDRV